MWLPRTEALQWTGRRWTREEWGGRCTFWSSPSCTCPFWQRAGMDERGWSWRLPHRYSLWTSETKVYKTNTFKTQYQSQVIILSLSKRVFFQIHLSLEFISRSISRAFKKKPKLFNSADSYSNIGSLDWPICTHPVGLGFPWAPRVTRWEILDLVVATDRLVERSGAGTVAVTGGNQAAEFISEEYKDKIYLS